MSTRALKRSRSAPVEQQPKDVVRIPIKAATATNLRTLNAEMQRAQEVLDAAKLRLLDNMRALYTENGIPEAIPLEVTETEPFELVVRVTKGGT